MPSSLSPGEVLAGRYRVERVLGEGGMGVVLAAEHLVLGERVAIKMLLPEAAKVPGVVQRFQREARAASRIQSEHVARVMDVGLIDETTPYLVMEYVEGRDLDAELEARGQLPIEEAVSYVLQAMVGVAEAHALGLVHRDLKPANLFLAKLANGRTLVKVLDFGIAKDTHESDGKDLTSTFSALGSAAYMSPEQVRMAKSVDVRSDVWAFGVVLFELLTGRVPFDGESVTAVAASIIADQPLKLRALRPDAPPELEAAIMGCLEKDRDNRTPTLAVLATNIAPFGGSRASMLAGRIAHALAPSDSIRPSALISSADLGERSGVAPEIAQTRPAWTTTGAKPGESFEVLFDNPNPKKKKLWLAAAALLVVGVGVAGYALLQQPVAAAGPPDVSGVVSTSTPPVVAAAAPAVEPTLEQASPPAASNSPPSSASAVAAPAPPSTRPAYVPRARATPRNVTKKPAEPVAPAPKTAKKPLVTAL